MKKFVTTILIMFCLFLSYTTPSFAVEQTDLNKDVSIIQKYITKFGDFMYFNNDKALKDNQPEDIIQAGNIVIHLNNSSLKDKGTMYKFGLKVYGNWCGPHHSGPGAPIDILDAGCMNHDMCYDKKGYFNCECDRNLINYIDANYSKMTGLKQKIAAKAIKTYFTLQTKLICW